jgi:hypothetical protein
MRFLSVDPLAERNVGLSAYNYVACNPIKIVDPDGKDNIVYILALPGADKAMIIAAANQLQSMIETASLPVCVYVVSDPANFDITQMDRTDAVAVVGGDKPEAIKYIQDKIAGKGWTSESFTSNTLLAYGNQPTSTNPETTDGGSSSDWSFVTVTTTEDVDDKSLAEAKQLGGPAITATSVLGTNSKSQTVATTIFHGMGYMAGISHNTQSNNVGVGIMAGGERLSQLIKSGGGVNNLIKSTFAGNHNEKNAGNKTPSSYQNRFKGEPKLNYNPNAQ